MTQHELIRAMKAMLASKARLVRSVDRLQLTVSGLEDRLKAEQRARSSATNRINDLLKDKERQRAKIEELESAAQKSQLAFVQLQSRFERLLLELDERQQSAEAEFRPPQKPPGNP